MRIFGCRFAPIPFLPVFFTRQVFVGCRGGIDPDAKRALKKRLKRARKYGKYALLIPASHHGSKF